MTSSHPRSTVFRSSSRRSRRDTLSHPVAALETLESRTLLTTLTASLDSGSVPQVIEFDAETLAENKNFLAFSNSFQGGVRVAMGDVNGDGKADLIAAAGPGGPAVVKVFDGATGNEVRSFMPFAVNAYQGGLYVAAGDINNDGLDDIIVGTGEGARSNIRVFDSETGRLIESIKPFKKNFTGGVTVAAGDVNGDGHTEIIAGTAQGAGMVMIIDGLNGAKSKVFSPFSSTYTGGVTVAAGDVNGDGRDDVVVGTNGGVRATVRTFDANSGTQLNSFEPYGSVLTGVRVAVGDMNNDGYADIITGSGPGAGPHIKIFDGTNQAELKSFTGFATNLTTGIYVAADTPTIKNGPPKITVPQTILTINPNNSTPAAPGGTVFDPDTHNFNGGLLRVTNGQSSWKTGDQLTLGNGVQIQGSNVLVSGIVVGTVSGGTGKNNPLEVRFNNQATAATAETVLQGVLFIAGHQSNPFGTRRIFFQLWDSGGATSGYEIREVNVV